MSDRLLNHIPLIKLAGIGASLESKFHALGIKTIQDLLLHFLSVMKIEVLLALSVMLQLANIPLLKVA